MLGVTWLYDSPIVASVRLRSLIPKKVLLERGLIQDGFDVIVASKHWFSVTMVRRSAKMMVMDVCDDHFHNKYRQRYLDACKVADVVTVNSHTMKEIVKKETGRDSVVIDDPYEDPELPPSSGDGVLWFGHSTNLYTLNPYTEMPYKLSIVDSENWTPELLDKQLRACRCTFIPTADKPAKSANRAIKSIRYGKFPVCGPMPAHAELGLGHGQIMDTLDWAMRSDTSEVVKGLQNQIRDRFSPETVADAWWKVFSGALAS